MGNETTTNTTKKSRFSGLPWGGIMVGMGAGMVLWHIAMKTVSKQQYMAAAMMGAGQDALPPAGMEGGAPPPNGNGNTYIVK
jgi:hypothetical protein